MHICICVGTHLCRCTFICMHVETRSWHRVFCLPWPLSTLDTEADFHSNSELTGLAVASQFTYPCLFFPSGGITGRLPYLPGGYMGAENLNSDPDGKCCTHWAYIYSVLAPFRVLSRKWLPLCLNSCYLKRGGKMFPAGFIMSEVQVNAHVILQSL